MPNKMYSSVRGLLGPVFQIAFLATIILFLVSCFLHKSKGDEQWSTWKISFKNKMDQTSIDAFKQEVETVFKTQIDSFNTAYRRNRTAEFKWSNTDATTYQLDVSYANDSVATPKMPCPKPPPSDMDKALIDVLCPGQ